MKLRVGWKNLCMLNDFKESDNIICEVGVNILKLLTSSIRLMNPFFT